MTSAEQLILRNQKAIMLALALLLPEEKRLMGVMLTQAISATQRAVDEAKTWPEA
jgi:hypothetical protein